MLCDVTEVRCILKRFSFRVRKCFASTFLTTFRGEANGIRRSLNAMINDSEVRGLDAALQNGMQWHFDFVMHNDAVSEKIAVKPNT